MKKIIFLLITMLALGSCVYRTGSGNIIKQTRSTGSFKGIDAAGGFDVEIRKGAENVMIEADDNLIQYIQTEVEGDILKIRFHESNVSNAHLKILVSAPEINLVKGAAGAEITSADELQSSGKIIVHNSSGSNSTLKLNAPDVEAEVSSGGEQQLSGHTRNFLGKASSGANLKAGDLLSENSTTEASSGSSVYVYASIKLVARASSGGNIHYKGGATVVTKEENSGGSVDKDD